MSGNEQRVGDALRARAGAASAAEPVPVSGKAAIPIAGHTPGPWTHSAFVADRDSYVYGRSPDGANRPRIAIVSFGLSCGNDVDAETEANARLIAAAPDLYNAAEVAHTTLGSIHPTDRTVEDQQALNWLADALAKARGEA